MRVDYRLVRRWWAESDGWSEADLVEADVVVKAAVDSGDVELITCWANWLAGIAKNIRDGAAFWRAWEEQVKKEAQAKREGNPA